MFIFSETPMMPMDAGRRSALMSAPGRPFTPLLSRENRQTPSSGTSFAALTTNGLTSASSMTKDEMFGEGEKAAARSLKRRNVSARVLGETRALRPRNSEASLPKKVRGSRRPGTASSATRWTELVAAALPSRRRSFMSSTSRPPPPIVRIGPKSRVFRAPRRISEPKPTFSNLTFSMTRKPRTEARTDLRSDKLPGPALWAFFSHSR